MRAGVVVVLAFLVILQTSPHTVTLPCASMIDGNCDCRDSRLELVDG